jgi:lysophospholipase L1-like esterase
VGKITNAVDLIKADNQYLGVASNSALSMGDIDFSIDCWFYFDDSTATYRDLIIKDTDNVPSLREYGLYITPTGGNLVPTFYVISAASAAKVLQSGTVIAGVWNYLAAGHDSVNDLVWLRINGGTVVTSAWVNGVRAAAAPFEIGGRSVDSSFWTGGQCEVGVWKRRLSTTDLDLRWAGGAGNTVLVSGGAYDSAMQLAYLGDSLTWGVPTDINNSLSYPEIATDRLLANHRWYNLGVPGRTTANVLANISEATSVYNASITKNVAVVMAGVNDMAGDVTPAVAYANLQSIWSTLRAQGWKVVVCTITPDANYMDAAHIAAYPARRASLNTLIKSDATKYDALADIAANSTIGDDGDELNTTYYWDKVHMYLAGYSIVADIVKTAVLTL